MVQPVVRVTFEGSLNHLEAELEFDYEAFEGSFLKDEEAESEARMFLREWGFEKGRGCFVLKDKEEIVRFHAYGRKKVPSDWVVREGERFRHAAGQVVEVTPEVEYTSSGEDWFGVSVGYRSGNGNALGGGGGETHFSREGMEDSELCRMGEWW